MYASDKLESRGQSEDSLVQKLTQLDLENRKLNFRNAPNGGGHKLLKFIPSIPESYCFVDENFHSDAFSVDGFVKRNSKRVHSLEKLKEELTAYLKILKHSMIELINEDYTEFINLSANLISFDKSINNIKTPVLKFKDETSHVQSRIEDTIVQLNAKQSRLKIIRDNKLKIDMILEIITNLNRIEVNTSEIEPQLKSNLIKVECKPSQSSLNLILDENCTLISRIQMNFDYLLSHVEISEKNSTHLLVKLKQRFDKCSKQFYQLLEKEIYYLLCYDLDKLSDEKTLNEVTRLIEKIIRIYLVNNNQKELERIICHHLVKPNFDLIICDAYLTKNGTQNMFEKILEFIDIKCALLIKVLTSSQTLSQGNSSTLSSFGYELLTGTLWKEFAEDCIVRTSALFSLANVDIFYRNYSLTFRFIEDFLYKTSLIEYRDRFENQKNFHQLKSKFNLNVFFYMKLQQIVPIIEKGFSELRFSLCAIPNSHYRMNITQLLHENLHKCWQTNEDKVYIGDLFCYFWKISLKIISRFASWIAAVNAENITGWIRLGNSPIDATTEKRIIHQTLAALIFDAQYFLANFTSLYQAVIIPLWNNYFQQLKSNVDNQTGSHNVMIDQSSLNSSFSETISGFHLTAINPLIRLIKIEIINECIPILDFVNDIPRLYRRTNKEKPSKASSYIGKCCEQLHGLIGLIGLDEAKQWKLDWMIELLNELTLHYKNATLEVLTSVQKTEDSLKKLKKVKPSANRNLSTSMSDDDKIRLQIYYDVQQLGTELQIKLNIDLRSKIKSYRELSEMVSSLKILI